MKTCDEKSGLRISTEIGMIFVALARLAGVRELLRAERVCTALPVSSPQAQTGRQQPQLLFRSWGRLLRRLLLIIAGHKMTSQNEKPGNRPGCIEVILGAETQTDKRLRNSSSVQK
jgi:hypothetical protein